MADNLDGDLKSLNSAWEGLRIRVADLVDGPLRSVTQSFTRVIAKVTALAQAHPELTKQLLIAGGALLAAVAATGALSLATGVLLGPLAKLRLGFSLLTGTSGLGRALPLLTQLRGVLGGSDEWYWRLACAVCRSRLPVRDGWCGPASWRAADYSVRCVVVCWLRSLPRAVLCFLWGAVSVCWRSDCQVCPRCGEW